MPPHGFGRFPDESFVSSDWLIPLLCTVRFGLPGFLARGVLFFVFLARRWQKAQVKFSGAPANARGDVFSDLPPWPLTDTAQTPGPTSTGGRCRRARGVAVPCRGHA